MPLTDPGSGGKSPDFANEQLDDKLGNASWAADVQFGLFKNTGVEESLWGYARAVVANDSSLWPAASGGQKANLIVVDFGSPSGGNWASLQELWLIKASISAAVFTGTGTDDATAGGVFAGAIPAAGSVAPVYTVEIDGTPGAADTFKWKKDSGSWTAGVVITGSAQPIADGVTIAFGFPTGHTVGDSWAITATGLKTWRLDASIPSTVLNGTPCQFAAGAIIVRGGTLVE